MFEFIKAIFRKRYLKRNSKSITTGLTSMEQVHTISIVIDASDNNIEKCISHINDYFNEKGIIAKIHYFNFSKKSASDHTIENTITSNDVNWYGRPSKEILKKISEEKADIFISLIDNDKFPITCIAKSSTARFKIGRRQLYGKTLDLVIEDSPSEAFTQETAFDEIIKYINTIK